jgi:hypothetical protein
MTSTGMVSSFSRDGQFTKRAAVRMRTREGRMQRLRRGGSENWKAAYGVAECRIRGDQAADRAQCVTPGKGAGLSAVS